MTETMLIHPKLATFINFSQRSGRSLSCDQGTKCDYFSGRPKTNDKSKVWVIVYSKTLSRDFWFSKKNSQAG